MPELETCLAHSHLEQCLEQPAIRDAAPCDPAAAPVPLIRIAPVYAGEPARRGTTGWVELEGRVSASGSVGGLRVIGSEPPGVFDEAALRAVRRWRFCPKAHHGKLLRPRFEFPER